MDERDANIDILFRNGLKDYEALPPQGAWDKIGPAIRKKQRPVLVFRAAATIAVLVSLGLLAYRWSIEISGDLVTENLVEINQGPEPAPSPVIDEPLAINIPVRIQEPTAAVQEIIRETRNPVRMLSYTPDKIIVEPDVQYHLSRDSREITQSTKIPEPVTALNSLYHYPDEVLAESNAKAVSRRWSVSALVSPTYYNRVSSGNNEAVAQLIAHGKSQISYTGGFSMAYKVNRRFTFQTGVYYASIGQEISDVSAYSGFSPFDVTKGARNFAIQTVNGRISTSNSDVFLMDNLDENRVLTKFTNDVFDPGKAELEYINSSVHQNFSYIEFPVYVRYKLLDKGIDVNVIGGLASNFLVTNSVYTSAEGGKYHIGETEDLNSFIFSSSLGMGMEYNFSGNLSLNLEPTFRYYLNPFSQMPGMSVHPFSFGIFSGLTYRF